MFHQISFRTFKNSALLLMKKQVIFAGGCFWCMEKTFDKIPGVLSTTSGYCGGIKENPTYREVCGENTGHYEALKVEYDDEKIAFKSLVDIYFRNIDPTDPEGQFNDKGPSYQTAVFYFDEYQKKVVEDKIQEIKDSHLFKQPVVTKVLPEKTFYPAEEYHQKYYIKNPEHYSSYYIGSGRYNTCKIKWDKNPERGKNSNLDKNSLEYIVTQEDGTEPPFDNKYNDFFEDGIYVDITTNEPLFSSKDKFKCSCGWPAFSKPINNNSTYTRLDLSHNMKRTEVRSLSSNNHLGHVFDDGPEELGGLRYCINSAAIKFIPSKK